MLRQRGGSEPLARTTRSASFQLGHTTGAVPNPVPNPDYHHQVLGGDKAETVARGLPAGLPAGWNGRCQPHHPQPPLFLSDAARAWLEHLPPTQISNWDDLVKAFAGNFQGTYVRPRNSWDLRSYRQQPGESLRDYIRRFSKQRTELPNITDSVVISAFLAGTTCRDLVSKLGRKTPTRASELMDIATKFASGQEAFQAIFRKDKQPQGRQPEDVPEASAQRGTKKKGKKKSQVKRDAADADLVAAAEHRNPRKPPGGANLFDKMLKESCPYHQGPVKHTLEECVMLRRYFHKAGPPAEGGRAHNNDKKEDHKAEEFPEVHDCFMIYGGHVANASARHRKQERREVCSVRWQRQST
jgi:hypothetical protein